MSTTTPNEPQGTLPLEPPAAGSPVLAFWGITRIWLTAPDRGNARWLIAGLLALTLAQVGIQIRFNLWNRDFFNALESRDGGAFREQILFFLGLAALSMAVAVYQLYVKQLIQLRWREWLTTHLVQAWLREGRHYQLEIAQTGADNPDQRIAEDVRIATDLAVDFATGLLSSLLMLTAFIGILWTLSGALHMTLAGRELDIPGYMVWAALAYALLGTFLTWVVGRPLVRLNVARTTAEADFRFGLNRARESGEGIALIRGEADEQRGLARLFATVAGAVRGLMRSQRNLMWLTSAYGTLAMIFPTIVASPAYFAGAITLGGLMQIGAAFGQVQGALNWFVDNFGRIAEWRSAVSRIVVFRDLVEELDVMVEDPEQPTISIVEGQEGMLAFRNLEVAFANGTTVIADASAEIQAGERVLIQGESGTGKSTLFRAIGGLWPWGAGEIEIPPREGMMFMPQRPYLPLGTLSAALCYPAAAAAFSLEEQARALERVGLDRLADQLAQDDRWDRVLSLGEQQRLAFARLLLHAPRWIFMDEATAALDEANQDAMMQLVLDALPDSALISIGHRPGLAAFHTRTLTLVRAEGGAKLSRPRRKGAPRQWAKPRPRGMAPAG
ncbi:ABC transporter ATP-binding protein/permease [Sediminicoccus sp. KRV36]|uniref:ABC transporter ATP-binding protein/permease n=1 Tax=Sediminicoccus sp. KRV36 TaxID=3133721 RepID=UPI00200BF337|nr:ABC transporter ATP-binding protein/permease [Sediminicoccus rosea]UPY38798.1 ABC transporter ATP-binding protein/permease [Sediminicoccus rosea]